MKPLTPDQIADLLAHLTGTPAQDSRDIMRRLAEPFPAEVVSWRVGPRTDDKKKGMALAYIDARDVMDRLDSVMGADWQDDYHAMPNGSYCCRLGLKIDGEWRWRSDGAVVLAANVKADDEALTQKEADAKEMAEKGTYSDAFKRAGTRWGIGRYLYSVPSPWVALDKHGKIAESEMPKLRSLLNRHAAAAREEARQGTREPRGEEPAETPERGATAGAANAQPSAAAAPAPARSKEPSRGGYGRQKNNVDAVGPTPKTGIIVEPAGPPTAEALLTGIMHTDKQVGREGLKDICRRIVCARKHIEEGAALPKTWTPDQYEVKALDEAYERWAAWHAVMSPKLSEDDAKKVIDAIDAYGKAAKKLDAAVAKRTKAAGAEGADPETGEILTYEPAEETA